MALHALTFFVLLRKVGIPPCNGTLYLLFHNHVSQRIAEGVVLIVEHKCDTGLI